MLELVIFDADGVLFDSMESNIAYYNAIFERAGEARLSPQEERASIFMAAGQVFEARASGDRQRLERIKEAGRTLDFTPFFSLMLPQLELRPFLLELKNRYRVALATNRSSTVPALIDHLGLAGVFDAVASVGDRVRPKPAPDIIELCLRRASAEPSSAVYVGDSETDRKAAEAAGTHFIGVGPRVAHRHRVERLAELPAALERLFGRLAHQARDRRAR
jgi:phosphoglycolate phosphatase